MKNRFMTLAAVLSFLTFAACKHTQKTSGDTGATGEGLVTVMSI